MSLEATRRFTQRADFYSKYRPSYPAKTLDILQREVGFDNEFIVADIGSGTGLLTKLFLRNGNKVFGVEPNEEMRSHAERDPAEFEKFVSVKGTAERTTIRTGSVDLVTVGQALHWFNPEKAIKEFSRISKPGGSLCVVYNVRRSSGRFSRAYRAIIRRNERDRAKVYDVDASHTSHFFKGGKYSKFILPNEQVLDFQGLLGRLLSASYIPSPSEGERFTKFEQDVRRLFDSYNEQGRVKILYDTNLFIGKVAG